MINKVVSLYAENRKDQDDLFQEIVIQVWKSFVKFKNNSKISTAIILSVGLVISVVLIKKVKNIDIVKKNYRQTLLDVNRIKKIQYSVKWISACLTPILAFSILPTLAATWFDKSLLYDLEEYRESLIPSLLLIPVIWYFISRFYAKKLAKINELLEEIKQ